jgi:hypothetical protein
MYQPNLTLRLRRDLTHVEIGIWTFDIDSFNILQFDIKSKHLNIEKLTIYQRLHGYSDQSFLRCCGVVCCKHRKLEVSEVHKDTLNNTNPRVKPILPLCFKLSSPLNSYLSLVNSKPI